MIRFRFYQIKIYLGKQKLLSIRKKSIIVMFSTLYHYLKLIVLQTFKYANDLHAFE